MIVFIFGFQDPSSFDGDFIKKLRDAEWAQHDIKNYPTFKFDSIVSCYVYKHRKLGAKSKGVDDECRRVASPSSPDKCSRRRNTTMGNLIESRYIRPNKKQSGEFPSLASVGDVSTKESEEQNTIVGGVPSLRMDKMDTSLAMPRSAGDASLVKASPTFNHPRAYSSCVGGYSVRRPVKAPAGLKVIDVLFMILFIYLSLVQSAVQVPMYQSVSRVVVDKPSLGSRLWKSLVNPFAW